MFENYAVTEDRPRSFALQPIEGVDFVAFNWHQPTHTHTHTRVPFFLKIRPGCEWQLSYERESPITDNDVKVFKENMDNLRRKRVTSSTGAVLTPFSTFFDQSGDESPD